MHGFAAPTPENTGPPIQRTTTAASLEPCRDRKARAHGIDRIVIDRIVINVIDRIVIDANARARRDFPAGFTA